MKLARLLESITAAKRLALHLQQLATEHDLDYDLEYHGLTHVNTVAKIQAITLKLSPEHTKAIIDGIRKKYEDEDDQLFVADRIHQVGVVIVIGELCADGHGPNVNVYDHNENYIEEYPDDELEKLVKLHMAPFSQYTNPA